MTEQSQNTEDTETQKKDNLFPKYNEIKGELENLMGYVISFCPIEIIDANKEKLEMKHNETEMYKNFRLFVKIPPCILRRNLVKWPKQSDRDRTQEGFSVNEDFGPTFLTVTDEDGEEITLEVVDSLEYNGVTYTAFFPAEVEGEDTPDEEFGLVILKTVREDGEDVLSTPDSDEELNIVYDLFMERLEDGFEEDDD